MADDVEARVRVAEEELNLLKNQVQQTLLDVREHILDLVDTDSAIPRGDRPSYSKDDGGQSTVAAVALPPTETGGGGMAMPQGGGMPQMPQMPQGGGMGMMPGLDMGGGGLGDMPGLDMGGNAGFVDVPDMTLGDADGFGEMPGLDMGGDAGFGDVPDMDMGGDAGDGGGFDVEEAPYVEEAPFIETTTTQSSGGGFADAPFDDPGAGGGYPDQGGPQPQGGYVEEESYPANDAGFEYKEEERAVESAPEYVAEEVAETAPATAPEPTPGVTPAEAPVSEEAIAEESTTLAPPAAVLGGAIAEMDLVTLVSVVRWVDLAVQRLGQRRVDALLDVWHMTGRISEPTRDMIQKLCSLTHEDEDERVPLRDLVAMMIQMEAVLDTEGSTNSRLLAMLFDGPGDPLGGLDALASSKR